MFHHVHIRTRAGRIPLASPSPAVCAQLSLRDRINNLAEETGKWPAIVPLSAQLTPLVEFKQEEVSYLLYNEKDSSSPFSTRFPSVISAHGKLFPSVEHFKIYCVAKIFGTAEDLNNEVDPRDYHRRSSDAVAEGMLLKFIQHPSLRTYLLDTDNKRIVCCDDETSEYRNSNTSETTMESFHPSFEGRNRMGLQHEYLRTFFRNTDPFIIQAQMEKCLTQ